MSSKQVEGPEPGLPPIPEPKPTPEVPPLPEPGTPPGEPAPKPGEPVSVSQNHHPFVFARSSFFAASQSRSRFSITA